MKGVMVLGDRQLELTAFSDLTPGLLDRLPLVPVVAWAAARLGRARAAQALARRRSGSWRRSVDGCCLGGVRLPFGPFGIVFVLLVSLAVAGVAAPGPRARLSSRST